jgi:hypothetical protein
MRREMFGKGVNMRISSSTAAAVVAVCVGLELAASSASLPAAEQTGAAQAKAASGAIPRTSWDGRPNLTGVWGPASFGPGPNHDPRQASPDVRRESLAELERLYQPWAREKTRALAYEEDPRLRCGPYGFPRYINIPDYFLLQIVQAPKETLVLVEYTYSGYRLIPTDGSTHPKSIVPSFFGNSIGRWEADTLVVDVTGFNGKIWLQSNAGGAAPGLGGGWITSDALHQVERWRLLDADTLEYHVTIEDPEILTGPWTTPKYLLKRAPPDIIPHEALCLEPEDLTHIKAVAKKEKK